MLRTRIIPTLLMRNESLVKTVRYGKFSYVGDPCNTARIFNELEVDEMVFLDITATSEGRSPNLKLLADIANECFMPLSYGGGVRSLDQAKAIFDIGFEKIIVNSAAITNPELITQIAQIYGSQAVIASIDVKNTILGQQRVRGESGKRRTNLDPVIWAKELESRGAGEIFLTSMEREGTWVGFDLELVKRVSDSISIPVIAHGGAGSVDDIRKVIEIGHATAVAVGSMVVFQKKGMGVLVNFPDKELLNRIIL